MAVHLYGICSSTATPPSGTGRGDAPLRRVCVDDLAALVSDVDENAPAGAKDLLAHGRVLEKYVEQDTVVPFRFGMVLPDDDAVADQVLRAEHDRFRYLLDTFEGVVQLTVQAFHEEEPALTELMRRRPDLVAMRDQLKHYRGPDLRDRQIVLGESIATGLEELGAEHGQQLLDELSPNAAAVVVNESQAAHEVLHAAFLVSRDQRVQFDEAVGAVRARTEGWLRLRYLGPQPPYSFVAPVESGELAWA